MGDVARSLDLPSIPWVYENAGRTALAAEGGTVDGPVAGVAEGEKPVICVRRAGKRVCD